jgi:hypothetical protein
MFEQKWKAEKPERYEVLEKLGYWSHKEKVKVNDEKYWQVRFDALKTFHDEMGHFQVPTTYREISQFGRWTLSQRNKQKKIKAVYPERYASLESLGFWASFSDGEEAGKDDKAEEKQVAPSEHPEQVGVSSARNSIQPVAADSSLEHPNLDFQDPHV